MRHSTLEKEQIYALLSSGIRRLLALGISGVGMSGLSALLAREGHLVVGYDRNPDAAISMLAGRVDVRADAAEIRPRDYDLVYYSLAMDARWERELSGYPSASRAQVLGAVMMGYRHSIAIAGSHGKSTVTALVDHILTATGGAPTTLLGATLSNGQTWREGGA